MGEALAGDTRARDAVVSEHEKLAQWITVKLHDPRILEIARHLAAWRIHGERFDTAFNAAVDEGRALPSQRAALRRFAMRDPEAAIMLVDARYPVTSAAPIRSRRAPEKVDPRSFDLDRRIHAFLRTLWDPLVEDVQREVAVKVAVLGHHGLRATEIADRLGSSSPT